MPGTNRERQVGQRNAIGWGNRGGLTGEGEVICKVCRMANI